MALPSAGLRATRSGNAACNYKDISPRIGLAYAATRNVSFRAGYDLLCADIEQYFQQSRHDGNPFFFDSLRLPMYGLHFVASGFPGAAFTVLASRFGAYMTLNRPILIRKVQRESAMEFQRGIAASAAT